MGFISFNLEFYRKELQKLETSAVSEETIYRAKQLLKVLDDLLDADANDDAFLSKLIDFCKWIGYEEDTVYIFLLRDTLVPYIYYQSKNRKKHLSVVVGQKNSNQINGQR